jgi:hypothetical protein
VWCEGETDGRGSALIRLFAACANDVLGSVTPSALCQEFLNTNDRARVQWQLEREFAAFERLPWWQ